MFRDGADRRAPADANSGIAAWTPPVATTNIAARLRRTLLPLRYSRPNEPPDVGRAVRVEVVERILRARNASLGGPLSAQELPDLVQDALVVILRKLPEFEGRSSLETWMYQICTFELMNAIRSKGRGIRRRAGGETALEHLPAREEALPIRLRYERLYGGLERLNGAMERVVRMKHYEERTFEEIGAELGITPSGAKHHYYRALQLLREYVAPPHPEGGS